MIHWRFIYRQIISSKKQASVFILCVALSLVTLVSLGSFSRSVRESALRDARELHSADIIISSHYPFSSSLEGAIKKYADENLVTRVRVHEFYSMALDPAGGASLLTNLKVVEKGYPFYGTVELASGRKFSDVMKKSHVIVEQGLLDRLQLTTGSVINIGKGTLTIADIVIREPGRPVSFFSLGPRVFVSAQDLQSLELIGKGSRIHYRYLLKLSDPEALDKVAAQLASAALEGQEHVETFQTAQSGIKKFFENFLFFLNLIGIFTLLLAGIGIQTALTALLRDSEITIAIMKTLGAVSRFITTHFFIMVMVLGTAGTVTGLCISFIIQLLFPALFSGILPAYVTLSISWATVFEGLVLGTVVVALFTFLPLWRIKEVPPAFIFRKEQNPPHRGRSQYLIVLIMLTFFCTLVIWQLEDAATGLYFVLGLTALISITTVLSRLLLGRLKKYSPSSLALRQAVKGLHRPRNATMPVIVTLTASLALLFSVYLIEQNLDATYITSYPPDVPNVYFLDIQQDQEEGFTALAGKETHYYPIIRARITAVNGKPIKRAEELRKKRDNLAREFNLTYRNSLLEDEQIMDGKSLFEDGSEDLSKGTVVPVSVLDTFAELAHIKRGDTILFKVQGIPLMARVMSIRTRTASKARPFFYFVFPEEVLADAPQTIFAATRLNRTELAEMQRRTVTLFPNISIIDVSQSLDVLARIMHKLSAVIQFFTSFSMIAGLLIIISSMIATQFARIREAVYYKVLGARRSFILKVFAYENLITGFICAVLAVAISQIGSWVVCIRIFEIPYNPFPMGTAIMMALTIILIISAGMVSSRAILQQKPAVFLRQQTGE